MGHITLKRIPRTKPWIGVIKQLGRDEINIEELSRAIADATRHNYAALEGNRGVNYCFWMLVRIITSSRIDQASSSNRFINELATLGINVTNINSGLSFIQQISKTVEKKISQRTKASIFVEMAQLSLREVLTANIVEESRSIFGTNLQDIQSACYKISSPERFGKVAREFFADFMRRTIQFITDKEISNYIGPDKPIHNREQIVEFNKDLSRYCYETARIVEEFLLVGFLKIIGKAIMRYQKILHSHSQATH